MAELWQGCTTPFAFGLSFAVMIAFRGGCAENVIIPNLDLARLGRTLR